MADVARTIEQRKRRWRDFYDFTQPPRCMFHVNYWETDRDAPLPIPENHQARIDYACFKYEHDLERAEWLDDDFVPFLYGITGTEVFAEAFGCPVHYYPTGDQNPVARPLIHEPSEVAEAAAAGAAFAYFGPVWDTPSKRGILQPRGLAGLRAACAFGIPVIAIGGVGEAEQVLACRQAGAHGVAVLRGARHARVLEALAEAWQAGA